INLFTFPSLSWSFLPHRNDNSIGSDISIKDFSVTQGDNPVHFLGHLFYTEKMELLTCIHTAETCPHVFKTPSTILAVIYVYFCTFSHILRGNIFPNI
ncbi:MAG: hypothetical protein KAQ71_20555, partial [Desulfobulbaceae bacterium]|nr:hypothetical protein [Desulfobulbaceae bacterium]